MPTPEQIKQEQIRREIARRQGQQYQEGALDKLPGVGPYVFKPINQFLENQWGRPPEMADTPDISRIAANALTLGGNDYVTNKILGDTRASEATQAARDRTGWGGTAVDVGAGMVSPIGLPKKIMQGGKVAKTLWNAGEAGVQGIIDAYTHNPDASWGELAKAGATSSGLSATVGNIVEPVSKWLSQRRAREAALKAMPYKNADDLATATNEAYDAARAHGGEYDPNDIASLHQDLRRPQSSPKLDAKGRAVLKDYRKTYPGNQSVSPEVLDQMRQDIRESVWSDKNGRRQRKTRSMISELDDFTSKNAPYVKDPVTGQPVKGGPEINQAWLEARKRKAAEELFKRVEKAEREARRGVTVTRNNPFGTSPEAAVVKEFSKLSKENDYNKLNLSPIQSRLVKQLEEGTPMRKIGAAVEPVSISGKFGGPLLAAGTLFNLFPGSSYLRSATSGAGAVGGEVLNRVGQKATKKQIEDLKSTILDPSGIGTSAAKADEPKAFRDRLRAARAAAAVGRTYTGAR